MDGSKKLISYILIRTSRELNKYNFYIAVIFTLYYRIGQIFTHVSRSNTFFGFFLIRLENYLNIREFLNWLFIV